MIEPLDILLSVVDLRVLPGLAAALATFMLVVAFWYSLVDRDPVAARLEAVGRQRRELAAKSGANPRRQRRLAQARRSLTTRVVTAMKLAQTTKAQQIAERLSTAGIRSREAVGIYLVARMVLPLAGLPVGWLLVYVLPVLPIAPPLRPLAVAAVIVALFLLPDLYVANQAAKRKQALQKGLPDGLDLLVICAEAGLSLDTALQRVAQEIGPSCPVLAEELALTGVELTFLPERRQALQNLARRTDLAGIRAVVSTLIQTEKYGTPLAQSLRVLSSEFREQRMLRAEEKAARLPATLTVPMIVFILPTLFVVLIGPAMLDVYDQLIKRGG